MRKKEILVHACCAPCFSYVYESLIELYSVVPFFYNPNILPKDEYLKRKNELKKYTESLGCGLIEGRYNVRDWVTQVKQFRFQGERSNRCWTCYRIRLEETFLYASKNGFDLVTTVLSISPHKDARMINSIGRDLSEKYNIGFYEADFKKNNGFARSVELSKESGFYRQDYCGCIYSKMERAKDSSWYRRCRELIS